MQSRILTKQIWQVNPHLPFPDFTNESEDFKQLSHESNRKQRMRTPITVPLPRSCERTQDNCSINGTCCC